MAIFLWALISATVSPIYYVVEKYSRIRLVPYVRVVAIILTTLMRGMWSIYTYLVIPVMIAEGVGPIQAVKRSRTLIRETWGEQLVSRFTFDIMALIIGLPICLAVSLIWFLVPHPTGQIIAIALLIGIMTPTLLFIYALRSIYLAALYEYAVNGVIPAPFTPNVIKESWEPRKVPIFG